MKQKLTITFALLMILFSTAIPGVYAMEDEKTMGMTEMNTEQMKEMTLEMIDNSIDSLTKLQDELENEDLLDSIDSLLKQMETLKTELEVTDDEDEIAAIMEEFRSSMEEAPDEIRETLMQKGPGEEGQGPAMEGNENIEPLEGDFPGNGTMEYKGPMNGDAPMDKTDDAPAGDETDSKESSEKSTGLLSGLINMIKSLF
jgi:hypothetical protein